MQNEKGYWIVVEGLDGSGKTTAIDYLKKEIESFGKTVYLTRGIGTGELGLQIRERYLTDSLPKQLKPIYMCSALFETYNTIQENINKGCVVITDRFIPSFYAYNYVANNDRVAGDIFFNILNNINVFKPCDLEVFINTDLFRIKDRLDSRTESNYIDNSSNEYFQKVMIGYKEYTGISNAINKATIDNNYNDLSALQTHIKLLVNSIKHFILPIETTIQD